MREIILEEFAKVWFSKDIIVDITSYTANMNSEIGQMAGYYNIQDFCKFT